MWLEFLRSVIGKIKRCISFEQSYEYVSNDIGQMESSRRDYV